MKLSLQNNAAFLLIVLLMTVLLTACEQLDWEGHTLVAGQVIDINSRQPIPNATVLLNSKPNLSAEPTVVFQSYQADSLGRFSFHFEAEKERQYELDAHVPGRYEPVFVIIINGGRKHTDLKLELRSL
jgi:hypothetical protein